MMDLAEIEERVLTELEWAGEENLPTLLNTILDPNGSRDEVKLLQTSLEGLLHRGLVAVAVERDESKNLVALSTEASLTILANLEKHLAFDSRHSHWTGRERPWPNVVSTSEGKAKGRQVMDRRGYQWWRAKE